MDESIALPTLIETHHTIVRATIAHLFLNPSPPHSTHQSTQSDVTRPHNVTLYPHQVEAIHRIRAALADFQGAVLCDDVGLGKTYVALTLAIMYPHTLIVAPAALRPMWTQACIRFYRGTRNTYEFVSMEYLSQCPSPQTDNASSDNPPNFIIIDEAHHARNANTKRYKTLSARCANTHTLLMSATPIHNTQRDLTTLLSLFLRERAHTLTPQDLARILIRRTQTQIPLPHPTPIRRPTHWIRPPTPPYHLDAILTLPPPIPLRAAGNTPHLATLSLLRQYASSDSALRSALRRRIARASSLLDAIQAGRYPSLQEIRAWLFADDSIQLAFPELITQQNSSQQSLVLLHNTIGTYTNALRDILRQIPQHTQADRHKAQCIRDIRKTHSHQRIIAFSQYTATVASLFRSLKHDGHVAALTGQRGDIATATLSRNEIINRFAPIANNAPSPHDRDDVTLLITTDILSEGVNLQDAAVLIHLDLPWTAAILEQRIGRIARIGSSHPFVTSYGFLPPLRIDKILRTTSILNQKRLTAQQILGHKDNVIPPQVHQSIANGQSHKQSVPEYTEAIRSYLRTWLDTMQPPEHLDTTLAKPSSILVSTTRGTTNGFLALCLIADTPTLIVQTPAGQLSTAPHDIYHTLQTLGGQQSDTQCVRQMQRHHDTRNGNGNRNENGNKYRSAIDAITEWQLANCAREDAGLSNLLPPLLHIANHRRRHLRELARTVIEAPWSQRAQMASQMSKARFYPTRAAPTFTLHVVALLLFTSTDSV